MSFVLSARRIAAIVFSGIALASCGGSDATSPPPVIPLETQVWAASLGVNLAAMTKLPSGVYIQDLTVGSGTAATSASTVTVYYTLWLANGTQVQSNVNGQPLTSPLSQLIEGWKSGIPGMKVGGKRRLIIP
ncbi:MAG: FKBP-type peptidyl-prolyl cis-trans isomerase, partial [Gemmatimonadaceae bacterium]